MREENVLIHTLHELKDFACTFAEVLQREGERKYAKIVLLSGDLGTGKTAFTKALASCLHIEEEITSPTFVIQKEYRIPNERFPFEKLIHIDAYRLERKEELEYLGWDELIENPKNLILIEWPEQVEGITLPQATRIRFEIGEGDVRKLILDQR